MSTRHYGLEIGDIVMGFKVEGVIVGFSPFDNNRAYVKTTDGDLVDVICENAKLLYKKEEYLEICSLEELLNAYTSDKGNWTLYANEHRSFHSKPEEYLLEDCAFSAEEMKDIDITKTIYQLYWYNLTANGSYRYVSNSIEGLLSKVKETIFSEKLYLQHPECLVKKGKKIKL